MRNKLRGAVIDIYRTVFARKFFYKLNKFFYTLSLNGLGILNFENGHISGENAFIRWFISSGLDTKGAILDVGANKGDYARMLRANKSTGELFCFEPHPSTFSQLATLSSKYNFKAIMKGMGDQVGKILIYDYATDDGSQHASVFKDVIERLHKSEARGTEIEITTIDDFVSSYNIPKIALLKVDTEGNELNVLKGAKSSIANRLINIIHLEFNEMNVISRTYFKDIIDLLPGYQFYRLLPDGMVKLGEYNPVFFEIFAFQNIIAIRSDN